MKFVVEEDGLTVATKGLPDGCGGELEASFADPLLLDAARDFLRVLVAYLEAGNRFALGETVRHGYWLVKLVETASGRRGFAEADPDTMDYRPGVTETLRYWSEQNEFCARHDAEFAPPFMSQMVVVSEGVFEGEAVSGVRYPSPDHMSGWWLTTDRYDGDIQSLRTVHAHHLTRHRPELARWLALPCGFRFFSGSGEAWFDPKTLA